MQDAHNIAPFQPTETNPNTIIETMVNVWPNPVKKNRKFVHQQPHSLRLYSSQSYLHCHHRLKKKLFCSKTPSANLKENF